VTSTLQIYTFPSPNSHFRPSLHPPQSFFNTTISYKTSLTSSTFNTTMSRTSSLSANPPSIAPLLRQHYARSSSISSGIKSGIEASLAHDAWFEARYPRATLSPQVVVPAAPDKPRHVRAMDKLRLWRDAWQKSTGALSTGTTSSLARYPCHD
jgi:hypothetical protein